MATPSCTLIAGPATELLTVTEAKSFLRVDGDEEDSFISDEIAAARQRCDRVTGRTLLQSTWLLSLDSWPCNHVVTLPYPPLKSVTSVQYIAQDGTLTTLAADQYEVDAYSQPGRIVPAYGVSWPVPRYVTRAIRITFVAGYATATEIPDAAEIRNRIRACVGYCYRNREERDEAMLDRLFESLWCGVV